MNNSSQNPNNPSKDNRFNPTSLLVLRRKQQVKVNPNTPVPVTPTTRIEEPSQRAQSVDIKPPKIVPNSKNARKRDQSYDASKDDAMEEEISSTQKRVAVSRKTVLFSQKDTQANKNIGGFSGKKANTSNARVAFGGDKGNISNYNKKSKIKSDLFDTNLAEEDIYKGKRFLFPVDIKIKTEKEAQSDVIIDTVNKEVKEISKEKEIIDTLNNEVCFFQLPANLPLEGCYAMTPKTENPDIEINTDDLLSSFLNNKFDSTGFYLERDFKFLSGKNKDKMIEEKNDKKSNPKDKIAQEKLYDTFRIGKLCRMKSGAIKMKIGNNLFDVTEGVQDSFYKELFAVDYTEKVAMSLFPIEKKFVVKPDMDSFY